MDKGIPQCNELCILFHQPDGGATIAFGHPPPPHCKPIKTILMPFNLALWKKIDGASSIPRIIDALSRDGWPQAEILSIPKILNTWAKDGLITWADQGQHDNRLSPREQRAKSIAHQILDAYHSAQNVAAEIQSSQEYHTRHIKNPALHFETVEPTKSHILRSPHPVLGGETYGSRLWEKLSVYLKQKKGLRVAEVGGGIGALAREFMNQLRQDRPDLWRELAYVFIDLSPVFLSSQRSKCHRHRAKTGFIQASGQCLPLGQSAIDLLICNEVIADFDVIRLCRDDMERDIDFALPKRQALDQIKRLMLSLEDAPPEFLFPWGAISFLEEVWRILAPGGLALIVEYGSESLYPQERVFEGHKEYTIHFGLLRKAAQSMGFEVKLSKLLPFLSVDPNIPILSRCGRCLLVELFGNQVKRVVSKIPTRQMLSETLKTEFESLENLPFYPIDMEFNNFWALFLQKPAVIKTAQESNPDYS